MHVRTRARAPHCHSARLLLPQVLGERAQPRAASAPLLLLCTGGRRLREQRCVAQRMQRPGLGTRPRWISHSAAPAANPNTLKTKSRSARTHGFSSFGVRGTGRPVSNLDSPQASMIERREFNFCRKSRPFGTSELCFLVLDVLTSSSSNTCDVTGSPHQLSRHPGHPHELGHCAENTQPGSYNCSAPKMASFWSDLACCVRCSSVPSAR